MSTIVSTKNEEADGSRKMKILKGHWKKYNPFE
jgi:hypothetical protein